MTKIWLSSKNYLSYKNPKAKNWKNRQKVGIHLILALWRPDRAFKLPCGREAFNRLLLAFTEAPIFQDFDLEFHIQIKTNVSGYAIGSVLSLLASGIKPNRIVTKTDLGQWHPIDFFLRKIIPTKTQYKTHNGEFLAIVEAFKTWQYYLEGCKHEVFVLIDHNNLRCFMDTKSLSCQQVRWNQKLSHDHFQIDYCQGKANATADALSRFFLRNQDKKDQLRAENGQILHCLQNLLTNASLTRLNFSSSLPLYLL